MPRWKGVSRARGEWHPAFRVAPARRCAGRAACTAAAARPGIAACAHDRGPASEAVTPSRESSIRSLRRAISPVRLKQRHTRRCRIGRAPLRAEYAASYEAATRCGESGACASQPAERRSRDVCAACACIRQILDAQVPDFERSSLVGDNAVAVEQKAHDSCARSGSWQPAQRRLAFVIRRFRRRRRRQFCEGHNAAFGYFGGDTAGASSIDNTKLRPRMARIARGPGTRQPATQVISETLSRTICSTHRFGRPGKRQRSKARSRSGTGRGDTLGADEDFFVPIPRFKFSWERVGLDIAVPSRTSAVNVAGLPVTAAHRERIGERFAR